MLSKFPRLNYIRNNYWSIVFVFFVSSYFIPVGFGFIRTGFYALVGVPVLFSLRRPDFFLLLKQKYFWPLMALCAYAIVRSFDIEIMLDVVKSTLTVLLLLLFSLKIPLATPVTVKKISLFFIFLVVLYVLSNAWYLYFSAGWRFGQRLSGLFGQSKSVIFTADFLMCVLISYSWGCIKTLDFKFLFLVHALVMGVAMFFLQSRSIIPVWLGCSALLIFTQMHGWRNILKAAVFVGLLGLFIGLLLFFGGMTHSVTGRGDSYRIEIWLAYLASTVDCGFVTGCGWGQKLGFVAADGAPIAHPHSLYVQHFYWGGVIGLSLLLASIVPPLIKGIRFSCYAAWPLLAGCIALVFDGNDFISTPNERWLLVLIPFALLVGQIARVEPIEGASTPTIDRLFTKVERF